MIGPARALRARRPTCFPAACARRCRLRVARPWIFDRAFAHPDIPSRLVGWAKAPLFARAVPTCFPAACARRCRLRVASLCVVDRAFAHPTSISFGRVGKGARSSRAPLPTQSFPECARDYAEDTAPVRWQHAALDIPMKAAVRPVANPRDISVLDGIEVNVIDMPRQIDVVTNRVLPIAALPNSSLAAGDFAGTAAYIARQTACRIRS